MKSFDDFKLRLYGPLVLFLIGNFLFRLNIFVNGNQDARLRYFFVGLLFHYICWNIARWVILTIQKKRPGLEQLRPRLLWLLTIALPVLSLVAYLGRYYTHQFVLGFTTPFPPTLELANGVGIQLFYHTVYIGIYEGWYVIQEWQKIVAEKEALVKLQWQSRFDSLKNQVNPHFLFNSLNSLSSLIAENPRRAQDFVDEMSTVYRYLLQTNDKALTNLKEELRFVHAYFHLLETRFGEAIKLELDVPPQYLDCQLAPLTLQVLLENAVKHNIISLKNPLTIEIKMADNNRLLVRNNLQRKQIHVKSEGVGLSNIVAKYQLMNDTTIHISETDTHFSVEIPLLPFNV
jgi:two-component system, LytTR family, sensor kinase